jgi:bacterioferritin
MGRIRHSIARENAMNAPIPTPEGKPTLTDVKTLRESARRHIEEGAVTEHYSGDRDKVLELLNEALATELVCVLRYRHDHFMAKGVSSRAAADEFLEHSVEEQGHADQIAERIVQLGGEPNFDPETLTKRSHAEYRIGRTVQEAIKENLVAERIAIDSYREMIQYIGHDDPTTRRMLEEILATEEEHADDLADLLDPATR